MAKRSGRKPKTGDRSMVKSGFTATAEQTVALTILSGENNTSGGVQQAVERLRHLDDAMADAYAAAEYVIRRSRQALGQAADEQAVLAHARDNLLQYLDEFAQHR